MHTTADQIIPFLPFLGGVLVASIAGAVALWNRRRGAVESRQPTATDFWEREARQSKELDLERSLRRWFESAFWSVANAFRGYVSRVTRGGNTDLTPHERNALDATPPNIDKEIP